MLTHLVGGSPRPRPLSAPLVVLIVPDLLRDQLQTALGTAFTLERELSGGGMSHVFVARDTAFDRAVVVKVLPPDAAAALSSDRFKREIALAAKLQHPHIVPLLGAGETAEGLPYYTMPFVEGESLRQKLAREGELAVPETVGILREVARALAYAHDRGIVHRDVKPDNVMISGGAALVTDFGVAKALSASSTAGGGTALTQMGVAIGTPSYMAPEQAAADPTVDHRADLYAFGCMAYEMLAGSPPFAGRPAQAVLAAHVTEMPEAVQRRRPNVPPALAALVMQCLEKRPADRPHDAGSVLRALEGVALTPSTTASVAMPAQARHGPEPRTRPRLVRAVPWLLAGTLAAALVTVLVRRSQDDGQMPPPEMRFTVPFPAGWRIGTLAAAPVALSPDGRLLAVRLERADSARIFVRALDAPQWRAIPQSDDASGVGFSTDSRAIFFTNAVRRRIVRVPVEGGPATDLAASDWSGALAGDGTLYYPKTYNAALSRVSVPGGAPEAVTRLDSTRRELGHWSPQILEGGTHLLFTSYTTPLSEARIEAVELSSGKRETLLQGGALGRVVHGLLVYMRGGALHAALFDNRQRRTTTRPQPVLDSVASTLSNGSAAFAVSESGTLAYVPQSVASPAREMVWVDRAGIITPVLARRAGYVNPRLSPDGTRIAMLLEENGFENLWVLETASGIFTPISRREANTSSIVWSPDGRDLFYAVETPVFDVFRRASDAAGPEQVLAAGPLDNIPSDVSPDGRTLVVEYTPSAGRQLATIPLSGGPSGRPVPIVDTDREASKASISPDGRWIAYMSSESGQSEIYLRSYPEVRRIRRQVSVGGGREPYWTRGGRELVFRQADRMMSLAVDPASGATGNAVALFDAAFAATNAGPRSYDVTRDGARFLMVRAPADAPQYLVVVANWVQNLRVRLANDKR